MWQTPLPGGEFVVPGFLQVQDGRGVDGSSCNGKSVIEICRLVMCQPLADRTDGTDCGCAKWMPLRLVNIITPLWWSLRLSSRAAAETDRYLGIIALIFAYHWFSVVHQILHRHLVFVKRIGRPN